MTRTKRTPAGKPAAKRRQAHAGRDRHHQMPRAHRAGYFGQSRRHLLRLDGQHQQVGAAGNLGIRRTRRQPATA